MSRGWRKFLEVLILGQFVMKRVRVSQHLHTSSLWL